MIPLTAPVAIVGAGMAGMTLAIALGQAGLSTILVDKQPLDAQLTPEFDGRVSAIAQGSRILLEQLGVWEAMAEHAQPILDIRVAERGRSAFVHYDHREVGDEPLGHLVENRHIRAAMQKRLLSLPAVTLTAPATWRHVERTSGRVTLTLADGQKLATSLLVAADGKFSKLRSTFDIGVNESDYDQTALVMTIEHERPHHGLAHEMFLPVGPFAILPMLGNRSSLVWVERPGPAALYLQMSDTELEQEIHMRMNGYLGAVRVVGHRFSYPLSIVQAQRLTASRFALIGDAAHSIHPIAGQGINLGFRDVAVLAEAVIDAARLGQDVGGEAVLQRYAGWRRFDILIMIAATDGINRLFSNTSAIMTVGRNAGLATVQQVPPLKNILMRHAMGTLGDLPRLLRGLPL